MAYTVRKLWRMLEYMTDDAVAKLYSTVCDETFSQLERNGRKFSEIKLSILHIHKRHQSYTVQCKLFLHHKYDILQNKSVLVKKSLCYNLIYASL